MDNYFSNTSFDDKFEVLRLADKISFYPWIGQNYAGSRSVIIGKTHKTAPDGSGKADKNNPEYTREVVFHEAIRKNPTGGIYADFFPMLFPDEKPDYEFRKRFFEQVAFFNLAKTQGTTLIGKDEFQIFTEIARIIEPKQCLFYGITLSFKNTTTGKTNENLLEESGVKVSEKQTIPLANDSFETATLELNGRLIKAVFCGKPVLDKNFGYYFPILL